jgi:2-polyprenyl-6-methoxyphenol hydroxylase-like FAD-dependent oxidoreductase
MTEDVLVVGAGPTGLAAALFLTERRIPCRVIDRAPHPSATSRAQVINPRALELLEPSGVTAAALQEARPIHRTLFYEGWEQIAELEFGDAHPRFHLSVLPQARSEALLAEALAKRSITPERGVALEGFSQNHQHVEAVLANDDGRRETVRTPILFGADGAHSTVRRALRVEFEGVGFPEAWPLYDVALDCPLDLETAHVSFVKGGLVFLLCIREKLWRVFGNVPNLLECLPPGTTAGEIVWESTFHIGHRVATRDVVGRVALGGDAAHIHSPVAARGMNLGIEDAYVFAACAADELTGGLDGSADRLADYGRVRHAVHEQVVGRIARLTQLARGRPDFVSILRRYLIPGMTTFAPTAQQMRDLVTGLDHEVEIA